MANNIFQQQITPIKPKVLESERIYVYVPTATKDIQGVASYNTRDFGVNNGHVSLMWPKQLLVEQLSNPLTQVSNIKVLADEFVNTNNVASITNPITGVTYKSNTAEVMLNRKNRDAFIRPDFVMLDDTKDFESSENAEGFVKYTLKRNNPLEQPSLIHISSADFTRENGIVKINWANIENKINEVDTKLQTNINNIVNNTTKIGDENNNFATKGGTIAAGVEDAVQLGEGENTEAGTFKFRHYTLIDKDGKVYTNSGNAAAITMKLVATEDFVRNLFSTLKAVTLKKVDVLPTVGETNIIYMVPAVDKENSKDYYEEYIYSEGRWELIGTTKVDMSNIYTKTEVDNLLLTAHKQLILGADGIAEDNVYNFTVESPDAYLPYRTNGTKFLVDLVLPIAGNLDLSRKIAITFGDTVYYVYNILSGNEPATIGDLGQVDKYNNATGYRFIAEMTFFETGDIQGFAIIPTISMSDVLSLTSDEMDHYLAEGGLSQGQLAICSKLIHNGYVEGALYRFDIHYPDTYTWTSLSKSTTITRVTDTDITTTEYKGKVELSEEQYNTLIKEGKVEVNGKMIEYSDDTEYETPDTSYSVKIDIIEPTATLEGEIGQFYLDSTNKKLYVCTGKVDSTYEWQVVGSGVSQEDFDKLINNETQILVDSNGSLSIGGASGIETNSIILGKGKVGPQSSRSVNINPKEVIGYGYGTVSIGYNAGTSTGNNYVINIGYEAHIGAGVEKAIQFGEGRNQVSNTLQIFNDNIYNHNTHTLTVQNIELNGNKVLDILQGTTAPEATTVGAVSQFYLDTTTKILYQCVAINIEDLTYEWKPIGGGPTQEELNNIINNTIKLTNSAGGFAAGENATVSNSNAGAISSTGGGAIGKNAKTVWGGSIGYGSESTNGFAGGHNAKATQKDSIQLGTGTNNTDKTLQVLDDNIYNADTHTLTVQNIELNSVDLGETLNEITPKVMRALLTPVSAPSKIELVAIDSTNSQTMIEIGEGLTLINGVLKATTSQSTYSEEVIYSADEEFAKNKTYTFTKSVGSYETIELELRSGGFNTTTFVKVKTLPSGGGTSTVTIPDFEQETLNFIVLSFTSNSMTFENSLLDLTAYANWTIQKIRWIHN